MIASKTKNDIFNHLVRSGNFFISEDGSHDIIYFLGLIWPLRDMPSTDSRYQDAYQDAMKHLVSNDDWSTEFTFLERFNLIEGDEQFFLRFLEAVLNPEIRKSKEEISRYFELISPYLRATNYRLAILDYFEELPVYKVVEKSVVGDLPKDMAVNKFTFYKGNRDSVPQPFFYLTYNDWDDFHFKTSMKLYCRNLDGSTTIIGKLKILNRNTKTTWDVLPDQFINLDNDFCSLGEDSEFYHKLKKIAPSEFYSVLLALRDVAFFPKIAEEFENEDGFRTSLIRFNETEQVLRTIRFEFAGIKMDERFKFNYLFKPPYSEDVLDFGFDFDFDGDIEHRIYAIIGKNGSGKTKLLSTLANDLAKSQTSAISPRKPLFGKIITISYSFFDNFDIPVGDALFNYAYCGLKKPNGTWLSTEELLGRFYDAVVKIQEKHLVDEWHKILSTFIPTEFLTILFEGRRKKEYIDGSFIKVQDKLSSGQRIQVYIITEILANIRKESLILYDEPETHLHPNAISALANTLFELVGQFDSFCIIATHSPLLIQELYSRNVIVIERENEAASLRPLEKECFAENLTVITDDIFGNRGTNHHFMDILKDLVERKADFDAIVDAIEDKSLPLNLNARLYIKSLLKSRG